MVDKLQEIEKHFEEIEQKLFDPNIVSDQQKFTELMKEQKTLTPIVEKFRVYKEAVRNADDAKSIISDSGSDKELKEMAQEELEIAKADIERINEELKILLLTSMKPKMPHCSIMALWTRASIPPQAWCRR